VPLIIDTIEMIEMIEMIKMIEKSLNRKIAKSLNNNWHA